MNTPQLGNKEDEAEGSAELLLLDINRSRDLKIQNLLSSTKFNLNSVIPKPREGQHCRCLIRFHNCTPHRVIPYWIDFKGLPIKYPALTRGASINIDTYVKQLWFFEVQDNNSATSNESSNPSRDKSRVLAIPEESLNLSCNASNYNFLKQNHLRTTQGGSNQERRQLGSLPGGPPSARNIMICSLCKYVLKQYCRIPARVPCPHFTGEVKLATSDIQRRSSTSNSHGSQIYSCNEATHRNNHSENRRNIYLVKSFFSLRERCFLVLNERIGSWSKIVDLNLPISLQQDYVQFIMTINKLDATGHKF